MKPFVGEVAVKNEPSAKSIELAKSLELWVVEFKEKIKNANSALDEILKDFLAGSDWSPEAIAELQDQLGYINLSFDQRNREIASLKTSIQSFEDSGTAPELVVELKKILQVSLESNLSLLERILALQKLLGNEKEKSH